MTLTCPGKIIMMRTKLGCASDKQLKRSYLVDNLFLVISFIQRLRWTPVLIQPGAPWCCGGSF